MHVRGEEVPRSAWASQQPRELFLFLVDQGPVRKDVLLELFWPSKSQSRATANLHQALYQARRAVGHDTLLAENGRYGLARDLDLDYDVGRFEQSAKAALAMARATPAAPRRWVWRWACTAATIWPTCRQIGRKNGGARWLPCVWN